MTTVSPTRLGSSHDGRLPRQRQPTRNHGGRNYPSRRHSPLSALSHPEGFSAEPPALQRYSIGDSSDEEPPKPMHLSALAKELLEDNAAVRGQSPPLKGTYKSELHSYSGIGGASEVHSRAGTPSRGRLRIARRSPPLEEDKQGPSPRVVHLSGSQRSAGGLRRAASTLDQSAKMKRHREESAQELITPAPAPRVRPRLNTRTNSETSLNGYHSRSASTSYRSGDSSVKQSQNSSTSQQSSFANPSAEENGTNTTAKTRSGQEALPNSLRVKRVPIGSGTFLRGAPVRRGIRRRQSEEEGQSPLDDEMRAAAGEEGNRQSDDRHGVSRGGSLRPTQADIDVQDFAAGDGVQGEKRASYPQQEDIEPQVSASEDRKPGSASHQSRRRSPTNASNQEKPSASSKEQAIFRLPSLPPVTSLNDQENEPPPTFKRNRSQPSGMLGDSEKIAVHNDEKESKMLADTHVNKSPKRQVLAPLSQNTPLRPAPPPPKMSVLETATATAGASTVKSKKKRSHVIVNGKMFTVRGRLGKGGSSDVYRVMAENDKMFALKKVNLEDCNEDTVRGYRGEIELLKKLENVDRVVRLFDWEVNEQKQSLSVLMEMGESDLNKILSARLQPENAKLDLSFTRYYWREMLSSVAAIHAFDIVHSDLKPANFLLVQGRLKLIDFGIANAIDTENTVNVHRETNVGTPNYMSPESLQDTNAGTESRAPGVPKLMKLGKPSDVWSLGCILYQITYGKPPFAYIANQWNRVMAIINPSVVISFPNTGLGGATVPSSLRRLLQRCLNRDASKRPTLAQLLDEREAFLNPDAENDGAVPMTEELLGQILMKVVERCKDTRKGMPNEAELGTYPKGFLDRIKNSLEKG